MPRTDFDPKAMIFTMPEVAAALSWKTRRTRRWLVRNGCARRLPNGRWVTSLEMLRSTFPELWQALAIQAYGDDDE